MPSFALFCSHYSNEYLIKYYNTECIMGEVTIVFFCILQRMEKGESLEGSFQAVKLISRWPTDWHHCVSLARVKFEKYFHHKVR